jgi:hypothetical protein
MPILAVLLLAGALLLTLGYHACFDGYRKLLGPDKAGAAIVFPLVLFLRWSCVGGVLWICIGKGGFGGPESRGLQYFLVFLVHGVLGVVSVVSGMVRLSSTDLSERTVGALSWVPFLLPAFQAVFLLTVLFPDAIDAGSLAPVRYGALGLMGGVGLAAGGVLLALTVREHRKSEADRVQREKEEYEQERAQAEAVEKRFKALTPESSLGDWLEFRQWDKPEELRAAALKAILQRPNLGRELSERILLPDHETARIAMYFVGELEPPPATVIEAIRVRVEEVVKVAESIDPNADDSRNVLYERIHTLATGFTAAAHGLRRAGVDLRPELRKVSAACGPREKAPPRSIADSCDRVIEHFDKLDREAAAATR